MDAHSYTLRQITQDFTVPQLVVLWDGTTKRRLSRKQMEEEANRFRASRGMPPVTFVYPGKRK